MKSRERVFSESTADRQILRWAHMLDEAFGLNEESSAETRRRARIQKAKERLAANALNGEAEEKARIICGMPDLVDICRGKYKKFIVYHERVIVVARLNGNIHVPFYCSTGLAGKSASSAKAGRWFVFWGIGRDGWFNKMELANDFDPDGGLRMHNQFGSKVLKAVADRLDAEVGDVAGIFADMPENAVTLEQARAAVNRCFKRDPIPWSDRHEPNSVIDYLNNMAGVFSGINDTAAVYRLILCGSMIGAEYFKGSSSETGFRLPQMRREKDSPPLSGNCRL